MRKLLLAILIVLVMATTSYAGTCVLQSADHPWSETDAWGTSCSGGGAARIPANGDDVQLGGFVVVWDVAVVPVIPATGSLGTITSTGSAGQISVDISDAACHVAGACKITATTITAGTAPATGGVILVSGTTDHDLTVMANIVGGSNASAHGLNNSGTGTVLITGTVTGGANATARGVSNATTGAMTINGNITGAVGPGLNLVSTGVVTITGDVTGGTAKLGYGVSNTADAACTLTGNMINTTSNVAWSGKPPTWNPGYGYYVQWYADSGNKKFYFDSDPGIANVAVGTSYYFQSSTIKNGTKASGGGGAWGF